MTVCSQRDTIVVVASLDDNSPDTAPESTSWWLTPDFSTACARFNSVAKVMGDHGLPPAVRRLLLENEECQHRETSGMPPKKARK